MSERNHNEENEMKTTDGLKYTTIDESTGLYNVECYCGKDVRVDKKECPHCGAWLGAHTPEVA